MELQLDFGDYYLVDENDNTIATTDKIMLKVDGSIKKLSKENCDEVYGGEVEIVTEPYVKYVSRSLETVYPPLGERNKLDENGCIILKKIYDNNTNYN
jgi:hypothetical protein